MSSSTIVDVRGGGHESLSCVAGNQDSRPEKWGRSLDDQVSFWQRSFPALDDSHILVLGERLRTRIPAVMMSRVECLVAIPKVCSLERFAPTQFQDHAYNRALTLVVARLEKVHASVYYSPSSKLGSAYSRLSPKTAEAYGVLEKMPGDFMVFPVQMGRLYKDETVERVRSQYLENEFGLCAYAVGCIVLAHEFLRTRDLRLGIDCPGGEFTSVKNREFDAAMCLMVNADGSIGLDAYRIKAPRLGFGSATGYLFK